MINQTNQVIKFPPRKMSFSWLPVLFFVSTGGLLVMMIFTVLGYQLFYLNRAYPGVMVAGVPVQGMTQAEIAAVVNRQSSSYLNRLITIHAEDRIWTFTGQELGLYVDAEATASQAYYVGRRGNLVADMFTHLSLLFTPRNIEPIIEYNTEPTHQVLAQLAQAVDQPPQDAALTVYSPERIELTPAQRGRRLHLDATRALIEDAVFSEDPQPLVAVVQQILPGVSDEAIFPIYQQVKKLLSKPFVFVLEVEAGAKEWRIEPAELLSMMKLLEQPGADGKTVLTLELDQTLWRTRIEGLAQEINRQPVDAQLIFNEESNQLEVLKESQDGVALDMEATYQRTMAAIANNANVVGLPVNPVQAKVSSNNLESLGIKEVVSEATSYFKGSSESRMNNIAVGASKFNGIIVPPGEVFSFNKYLGDISKEMGFDEALVIYGDRTAVGIGGGICQVSTTAFRAALFGGYEIVERWAHGYRVGWYEINSVPGLDATIYTPDVDFKFRNDTAHYLLIQTETDLEAGTLTFKFFGTSPGREVTVSEPVEENLVKPSPPLYERDATLPEGMIKQVDWAQDGLDVTVTRVVKEGDKIIHEDTIVSYYQPWRAIYRVGTKKS
jgi:vancomycin resistance protein YoaR